MGSPYYVAPEILEGLPNRESAGNAGNAGNMEFMEWRELERVAPTVTGASLELDIGALVLRYPLAPLSGLALLRSFFLGPTATACGNHARVAPILLLHCHLFVIAVCEKKKKKCVCLCVFVCVGVSVYAHTYVCVCLCMHMHMCWCVSVYAYTYVYMYMYTCTSKCIYAHICMYITS